MIALFLIAIFNINRGVAQISTVGKIHKQPSRLELSESLRRCCESVSDGKIQELMECTNTTVSSYYNSVYSGIPYNTGKEGPRFVVSLITRATPQIYSYASYSYFLQAAYADHNGYALLPLYPDSERPDYERFRKLVPLSDALRGVAVDCDYLVWMDAGLTHSTHFLCFKVTVFQILFF